MLGVLNNEKIKAINNKIEQNKAQYNLDRQTAKSSALSSENVSNYEFLTGRDVYLKNMLAKPVALTQRIKSTSIHCKQKISKIRRHWRVLKNKKIKTNN